MSAGGSTFSEPKVEDESIYPEGATKPPGSNYTRTLVVPKVQGEDTSWIDTELSDMLESGLLTTAIYHMDDRHAPLHPLKNKGHEAMAYLTYLIAFYDDLPDTIIFTHAHRFAWHNNELLNTDASLMIRHLSPPHVARRGYVNLRCHWRPGCPTWLHPASPAARPASRTRGKEEEVVMASAWKQLFPLEPLPAVLSQPCCAQFALSRDRARAVGKARYIHLRDWLLKTDLSDYLTGRIFEYVWQYLFTGAGVLCPSMSACYCDGYGLCFGGAEEFDGFFGLVLERNEGREDVRVVRELGRRGWEGVVRRFETAGTKGWEGLRGMAEGQWVGWLEGRVERLEMEMWERRRDAFLRGQDPRIRAEEVGRAWVEGDGF